MLTYRRVLGNVKHSLCMFADLQKVFDIFDKNHDGLITLADLDRTFEGFNLHLSASERQNAASE